ncbi:hypothetical protein [Terriglobus roseus]|uniref:Uncharacterized protein n=1 Tax=Terriglobus roseus TaxID=392734 RepID=A0A1H4P083_9BACT|nr:hypothetical protein [Terriglobus roseus]SEC00538.1 hypothetical protein SAMN05443244_2406 [Terriglobus roseus]
MELHLSRGLRVSLALDAAQHLIDIRDRQQPGTRNWSWNTHPAEKDCNSSVPLHDALITHILDSETEHDVVMPGGLSIYSTEAAAEFLVDPDLRSLARSVPMGRDDRVLRDGARNRRNREHRRSRTAGDVQRRISVG